jgi:hypothetical protein
MAEAVVSRYRRPLGELLVLRGIVDEGDVAWALREQRAAWSPLGQILIARGAISPLDLESTLAEQESGTVGREAGFGAGLRAAIERSYDRRHGAEGAEQGFGTGLRKRLTS